MRAVVIGGLAAALVAGLAATAAAAGDDDDVSTEPAPFKFGYTGKFGKPRSTWDEKQAALAEKRAAAAEARVAARREQEFNAYLRRMDACDRLMDIAISSNNEEMQRKVEQLSERVWATYQRNTSGAGVVSHLAGTAGASADNGGAKP